MLGCLLSIIVVVSDASMDILLRHTILGESIRLVDKSYLAYAEERDRAILKNLITLNDAQSDPAHADENTALLEDGEEEYGSSAILVDWYDGEDSEVSAR